MSSDARTPHAEALALANEFVALIRDQCEEVEIAGSLRRQKKDVGDIEVVIMPKPDLFTALDKMVAQGVVTKAIYPNGTPRWGTSYRGVMYRSMKIEIFTCDANNRGYITWLRTGPGDANTLLMQKLIDKKSPYRFQEGHLYWSHKWTKSGDKWHGENAQLIPLPDEATLFRLLGLKYLEPQDRSDNAYARMFASPDHGFAPRPHVCHIFTGRINTNDPDALDITIKSASTPEGEALAPSDWDMVKGVKSGAVLPDDYRELYLAVLRQRYVEDPTPFLNILKRDRVILTCYCNNDHGQAEYCHRYIAVEVLTKIAKSRNVLVVNEGELKPEYKTEMMFG